MNKAYEDAYYNSLRQMGYKIRYKQTFKQKFKNFIALVLTAIIISIIAYIAWQIPAVRERVIDAFTF